MVQFLLILFLVPQCKPSRGRKRGICWCVDKYGVQLPGTDYSGGDIQCKDLESSNNNEWKSGRTTLDAPSPPPLAPNHHVTQGPRLLSESHLYAPPSVHFKKFCFVFFLKSKKKEEEKKIQNERTGWTKDTCIVFYFIFYFFSFLFLSSTKHSSPREGKKKSQKISPSVPWLSLSGTSPSLYEAGPLAAGPWKYMHPMDIFL